MPTEAEFLSAAALFDEAADSLVDIGASVPGLFGPQVVTGGQLTVELEAFIAQTTAGCGLDSDSLIELAHRDLEIVGRAGGVLQRVDRGERDRAVVEQVERGTATRAEVAVGGIAMAALIAERV